MKPKQMTLGAILVALTCIILYSSSLIPINTLTILTIASALIPVAIIRSDIKTALLVYIASSIITFFMIPINISILYFLFFGIYGIIKYLCEKSKKRNLEVIYKFIFFNIIFFIAFFTFERVLGINILLGIEEVVRTFINSNNRLISFGALFLLAQVVFWIYDYALTLIITFYMDRIHNKK